MEEDEISGPGAVVSCVTGQVYEVADYQENFTDVMAQSMADDKAALEEILHQTASPLPNLIDGGTEE